MTFIHNKQGRGNSNLQAEVIPANEAVTQSSSKSHPVNKSTGTHVMWLIIKCLLLLSFIPPPQMIREFLLLNLYVLF